MIGARDWLARARRAVHSAFGLAGLEVRRRRPGERDLAWLAPFRIGTVLDIGANVGKFSSEIHRVLPGARIYAFEPLADLARPLRERMQSVDRFRVLPVALGEANGEVEIRRSAFTPASSLLSMAALHREAFPHATPGRTEIVEMRRLDDLLPELEIEAGLLIKIDVQGYEDRVIRGGRKCFDRAAVVIVETSFEELYTGQARFEDVYGLLGESGLRFSGMLGRQRRHPADGRILQGDALFLRSPGRRG